MMNTQQHPKTSIIIMILSLLITSLPKLNGFRTVRLVSKVASSDLKQSSSPKLQVGHQRLSAAARSLIRLSSSSSSSTEKEAITNDEQDTDSGTWQNPRSRWARRKHRRRMEKLQQDERGEDEGANDALHWDKFEFGDSPKMDKRFASDSTSGERVGIPDEVLNNIPADSVTYKSYVASEAELDSKTSQSFKDSQSELLSLSPEIVQRCIDILSPYVQDRRMERIDQVLSQRTRHTRFLFENPSNPSNVWACLRTLDSFGIQYVDVIIDSNSYAGKAAMGQKRGMRTAMGSACWMTLRQFGSTEEATKTLREEEGCLIYASDLNPSSMDVRNLNWDVNFETETNTNSVNVSSKERPICVVMGNEDRGISDKMRELADKTFYLPMCGFAESFNLSVATAITLAHMSAVSNGAQSDNDALKGPLRPGDLNSHELQCLRLKGMLNSLAQKRMGKALLKKEGIVLPNSLYD